MNESRRPVVLYVEDKSLLLDVMRSHLEQAGVEKIADLLFAASEKQVIDILAYPEMRDRRCIAIVDGGIPKTLPNIACTWANGADIADMIRQHGQSHNMSVTIMELGGMRRGYGDPGYIFRKGENTPKEIAEHVLFCLNSTE